MGATELAENVAFVAVNQESESGLRKVGRFSRHVKESVDFWLELSVELRSKAFVLLCKGGKSTSLSPLAVPTACIWLVAAKEVFELLVCVF